MAKLNLDLTDVKVQTGSNEFSIVPSGIYNVVVGSANVRDTKGGSALVIGYEIVDGEQKGCLIKDFLNIVNPSSDAQRIALERLATIVFATNAPTKKGVLEDTDNLLGKEVFSVAVVQEDDGQYKNMRVKAVVCTRDLEPKKEEPKKAGQPWKV